MSLKKRLLFATVIVALAASMLYMAFVIGRASLLYHRLKQSVPGWRGALFAADPALGFALRPNVRGAEALPIGPDIPAWSDREGFRVPEDPDDVAAAGAPRALALGCSFTFGAACRAEETFPYHVSHALGFRCINAGVPGYGLSQMLIRARSLIPRYKPRYVIVQYSPWLVQRSQNAYAPAHFGLVTCPYFAASNAGEITPVPPVFAEIATELPASAYRQTRAGLGDFLSFNRRVALPLFLHDDCHGALHRLKRLLALTPAPCADGQKIVNQAYGEIARLCDDNQARLIILVLGAFTDRTDRLSLKQIPHARVVDAHAALIDRLPNRSAEEYARAYCHWRGNPPRLVDTHPNARAHWLITAELTAVVRAMDTETETADATPRSRLRQP